MITRRGALAGMAAGAMAAVARPARADSAVLAALVRDAAGPGADGVHFLLLDGDGAVQAESWPREDNPFPAASLVKPFTALAYGFANQYRYGEFECKGCWLARGHGRIGIVQAIAQSCNSYFEQAAVGIDPAHVWSRYGLLPPSPLTPRALAGEAGIWRTGPLVLARAYLEIWRRRTEPGVGPIIEGLRTSARSGTAAAVGQAVAAPALAKTGTSVCTHTPRSSGDGLTLVLYPAGAPRYVLLIRKHGTPGFLTAAVAGRIVRRLAQPV